MLISDFVRENIEDEDQFRSLNAFLYECGWLDKEITPDKKLNHKQLMEKVREYTRTIFVGREVIISSMNDFIDELKKQNLLFINKGTIRLYCQVDKLYDSTEMKVKLLKFLQGKGEGKSRLDIAEHFNISQNALSTRIQEMDLPNNQILGVNVRIKLDRGTNLYDSTCHPLFLALNLTEVYSMFLGLMRAERLVPDDTITNIIKDIVSQLTDYAKGVLKESGLDIDAYSTDGPRSFRNEATIDNYYHMMKTRTLCRIWLYGRDDSMVGRLKPATMNRKDFLFCPEDGSEPFQLNSNEIKNLKKEGDTKLDF